MTPRSILEKYGFRFGQSGTHSARSMMLAELQTLFAATELNTSQDQYKAEVCQHNVLEKPTLKSRLLTFRHLTDLYGMSTSIPLFRVFRKLWSVDELAQPVLAIQMALVRDPLLRSSMPLITDSEIGTTITRQNAEDLLSTAYSERYSSASLKSYAQNINGSWTQAGFLRGRSRKIRSTPRVTPVNLAFALFVAFLEGASGERLLRTKWCNLLMLSDQQMNELAVAANNRGLIEYKRSGGVIDVRFAGYLAAAEERWRYE